MSDPSTSDLMAIDAEATDEFQFGEIDTTVEMEVLPTTTVQTQPEDVQTAPVEAESHQQLTAPIAQIEIEPAPIEHRHDVQTPPRVSTPPPAIEQQSYQPQFSLATSRFIMSRHRGATPASPPPHLVATPPPPPTPEVAPEEVEDTPVDYSHLPMTVYLPYAEPQSVPPSSVPSSGAKRKRAAAEDEASRKSANIPAYQEPAILKRPVPRPPMKRKRTKDDGSGNPMCVKCNRISATDGNPIVPCGCGEAWHQLCHDPEISADALGGGSSKFKCVTCKEEDKQQAKYQRELAKYREAKQEQSEWKRHHNEVERKREKKLATLPQFPKPSLIGFEGGSASGSERREYFSGLKRSDLLNLLLFSEQIHPGLLVDVLASVSKKHPDLPLFSSPDWAEPKVQHRESQPHRQQDHRPASKPSKQRSKTGGVRKILKTAPTGAADQAEADAEDSEDALPESWPKAGHGLYQRLKSEKDDPMLYDDNDEEAFSHFMVDNPQYESFDKEQRDKALGFLHKKLAGITDGAALAAATLGDVDAQMVDLTGESDTEAG
ncbi:hypothetical protein CPAR01_09405 [Colletotrichum paranaense]|uniref:Zinc finger PHD-type domain-containing protein n=1 Tax=Colletotrichum paranaense TaxID=1914294 RepID=A0ABQ9SGP1_9PEZI|nr:uncharacterized protein CPAR01_09405 [Colletotrichum paranaense]KAK1535863.1 hypothetical protein CPAR01_09405 [Colletotrichum paranaense]